MINFIVGLAGARGHLLTNILRQNPHIHFSEDSGLIDMVGAVARTPTEDRGRLLAAVIQEKYAAHEGKVILDGSPGWADPSVMATMEEVLGHRPRIVAVVRPTAECVAALVEQFEPPDAEEFCKSHPALNHMRRVYDTLRAGYAAVPENFLFVRHADLSRERVGAAAQFLGLPEFDYDCGSLRPIHVDPAALLANNLLEYYSGGAFWDGPDPIPPPKPLDVALDLSLHGHFEEAEVMLKAIVAADPTDVRARFNLGWYRWRDGQLLEGIRLNDLGRAHGLLGIECLSTKPMWEGQDIRGKVILMNLQAGFGDQIVGMRFARYLKERTGCAKVIVTGSPELAPLVHNLAGVDAFIDSRAATSVYHDYWVHSMQSILPMGIEYADLSGEPYIPCRPKNPPEPDEPLRVGLRWAGNPEFEHQQYRIFDPTPLWNIKGCELVSLQRDAYVPMNLFQPSLRTWEDTRDAIETLDLVISSCTSVAHLSAAMGKPTWIIVPVLAYTTWAQPGPMSPWYGSVRLFRQTEFGNWDQPINEVLGALEELKHEHKGKSGKRVQEVRGIRERRQRPAVQAGSCGGTGDGLLTVPGQQRVDDQGAPHSGAHRAGVFSPDEGDVSDLRARRDSGHKGATPVARDISERPHTRAAHHRGGDEAL